MILPQYRNTIQRIPVIGKKIKPGQYPIPSTFNKITSVIGATDIHIQLTSLPIFAKGAIIKPTKNAGKWKQT